MPGGPGAGAHVEGLADGGDEAGVLVDGDGEGEGVVLGVAGVEVAQAQLQVGEGGERGGERGGELDVGEGGERVGEVGRRVRQGAALRDGRVERAQERLELRVEGVEVEAAVLEPLSRWG